MAYVISRSCTGKNGDLITMTSGKDPPFKPLYESRRSTSTITDLLTSSLLFCWFIPTLSAYSTQQFDLVWVPFTAMNYLSPEELHPAFESLECVTGENGCLVCNIDDFPT